jgi:hypothetical protein
VEVRIRRVPLVDALATSGRRTLGVSTLTGKLTVTIERDLLIDALAVGGPPPGARTRSRF